MTSYSQFENSHEYASLVFPTSFSTYAIKRKLPQEFGSRNTILSQLSCMLQWGQEKKKDISEETRQLPSLSTWDSAMIQGHCRAHPLWMRGCFLNSRLCCTGYWPQQTNRVQIFCSDKLWPAPNSETKEETLVLKMRPRCFFFFPKNTQTQAQTLPGQEGGD